MKPGFTDSVYQKCPKCDVVLRHGEPECDYGPAQRRCSCGQRVHLPAITRTGRFDGLEDIFADHCLQGVPGFENAALYLGPLGPPLNQESLVSWEDAYDHDP